MNGCLVVSNRTERKRGLIALMKWSDKNAKNEASFITTKRLSSIERCWHEREQRRKSTLGVLET